MNKSVRVYVSNLHNDKLCTSGGVAQWVARLTKGRRFEPHQRPPLFPWARNITLTA